MIEKLRAFIENSNKEIQKKLLTEINVESSENDILVQSFLTKDFKEKIKGQLETIYRYIGRCGYKDIEILKSKLNLFFYKGSSNIEDLVEENEKAIEFLRSNKSEKSDSENNNKLYELSRINNNLYRIKEYAKSQVTIVNGGTMPEDLPRPEKSIKQGEREQLKRLKDKKTKLMLDE